MSDRTTEPRTVTEVELLARECERAWATGTIGELRSCVERAIIAMRALEALRRSPEPAAQYPLGEYEDWPECEEFYNLCQSYRHTPVIAPDAVSAAYEALKYWLRGEVATLKSRQPSTKSGQHE